MADVHFAPQPTGLELTEEWALQWESLITDEYTALLPSYRARVEEHWQSRFLQSPESFLLATTCEVVIVATLMRYWVFVRQAPTDTVRVESRWEDEELDTWQSFNAPEEVVSERVAQRFLDSPTKWDEIESGQLRGATAYTDYPVRFHDGDPGHNLADEHAHTAALHDAIREIVGDRIDRQKLAAAKERLAQTALIPQPQRRGKKFERVLADALEAHGCRVELGRIFNHEQIDVFLMKPQVAVVEVRWTKKPLERDAIDVLVQKTMRRPPVVSGLYVSMGGFTAGARLVSRETRERAIFLMDAQDVDDLFAGKTHFNDFWQSQVETSLLRYEER